MISCNSVVMRGKFGLWRPARYFLHHDCFEARSGRSMNRRLYLCKYSVDCVYRGFKFNRCVLLVPVL